MPHPKISGIGTSTIRRWTALVAAIGAFIAAVYAVWEPLVQLMHNIGQTTCEITNAPPWCVHVSRRTSETIGGEGGDEFDDSAKNPNEAAISSLAVDVVSVPTSDGLRPVVGRIRVQWENGSAQVHGLNKTAIEPIELSRDEVIKEIQINDMTYNYPGASPPPTWISGITVVTNKRVLPFGNTDTSEKITCAAQDKEQIVGFIGRSGDFLDQLGCIYGKRK